MDFRKVGCEDVKGFIGRFVMMMMMMMNLRDSEQTVCCSISLSAVPRTYCTTDMLGLLVAWAYKWSHLQTLL
jgi:hypothetical protein